MRLVFGIRSEPRIREPRIREPQKLMLLPKDTFDSYESTSCFVGFDKTVCLVDSIPVGVRVRGMCFHKPTTVH